MQFLTFSQEERENHASMDAGYFLYHIFCCVKCKEYNYIPSNSLSILFSLQPDIEYLKILNSSKSNSQSLKYQKFISSGTELNNFERVAELPATGSNPE